MKWWVLALLVAGCGRSSTLSVPDAGPADSAPPDDLRPDVGGQPVWSAAATRFVVVRDFGYGPPPPAQCSFSARYTFTTADLKLAWTVCSLTAAMPVSGQRTLSDSQWQTTLAALGQVVLTRQPGGCGADKADQTLVVTTPAGETTYRDSFYACGNAGLWVDGLDSLFIALDPLAY